MIRKELLEILACPKCRESLNLISEKLICRKCRKEYPIIDGIPVMLVDAAQKLNL